MNRLEILNEVNSRKLKIAEIMDLVADEKRELKNVEKITLDTLKEEISEYNKRMISAVETPEIKIQPEITVKKEFNILRAISDYVNGYKFDEVTQEVINRGKEEFRSAQLDATGQITLPSFNQRGFTAGTATAGQELVAEDKWAPIGALRNNLVLVKAGAKIMTGLTGTVSVPKISGTAVDWALENGTATESSGVTSEITMAPFRLTAYVDVSKLLLNQTSFDAQRLLIDDINKAVAVKLESSILDATAAGSTRPAGVLNGVSTTSGTTSFATIVGMEGTVNTSNALTGNLAYITHPTLKSTLKTTQKASGTGFIMENENVNGYPVFVTAAMPASGNAKAIIFGDWSNLVIGQWGNTDITIDPYSQSISGKVRLVVNTYWNWTKLQTESFDSKYLG